MILVYRQFILLIAYNIGDDDNSCTVGENHKANYLVKYKDEYYNIIEGDKLDLYTCEDLINMGVIGDANKSIIDDLNDNSNFELDFITEITEDIIAEYSTLEGFGVYYLVDNSITTNNFSITEYIDNTDATYYEVTSYPDYMSVGDFVTTIVTTDPEIQIYDLFVGKAINSEEINLFMETLDYFLIVDNNYHKKYTNDRVSINIYFENGIITKLKVDIEITNNEDIQY